MRRNFIWLIAALLFVKSESALSIGRIGNSTRISDPIDRYSTDVPRTFASISQLAGDGVVLDSGLYSSFPPRPVDIQVLPLRTQYPQFATMDRAEVKDYFLKLPRIVYSESATNNGALSLIGENASSYVGVSVCEGLRGYVLLGTKLTVTREAFESILANTKYEGKCLK